MRALGMWLALAGPVAASACSPPPQPRSARDLEPADLGAPEVSALVVGCWSLEWTVDGRPDPRGAELTPDSVSLRAGATFGSRERIVSPATRPEGRSRPSLAGGPRPWETRFRVNRWWTEGEALTMRFSDGERAEWLVSLDYASDGLSGEASYRDRGDGSTAEARVRGARISCLM